MEELFRLEFDRFGFCDELVGLDLLLCCCCCLEDCCFFFRLDRDVEDDDDVAGDNVPGNPLVAPSTDCIWTMYTIIVITSTQPIIILP